MFATKRGRPRGIQAAFKGIIDCIKAFSEIDFIEELKKFEIPTLVPHGDDYEIVPIEASALLSSKLIENVRLKICKGVPHGIRLTRKDLVKADLLDVPQGVSNQALG